MRVIYLSRRSPPGEVGRVASKSRLSGTKTNYLFKQFLHTPSTRTSTFSMTPGKVRCMARRFTSRLCDSRGLQGVIKGSHQGVKSALDSFDGMIRVKSRLDPFPLNIAIAAQAAIESIKLRHGLENLRIKLPIIHLTAQRRVQR
jgi:hypothetical protein